MSQPLMTNEKPEDEDMQASSVGEPVVQVRNWTNIFGGYDLYRAPTDAQKPIGYLEGLKGLIAFQGFLWVFMRTIVPGAVTESIFENPTPPHYQRVLREIFSPWLWDGTLQYSFFMIISARLVCVRWLQAKDAPSIASSIFRRGVRLWFPCAFALAIAMIINHSGGFDTITVNATYNQNHLPKIPYQIPNALAFFNSVFNLFWFPDYEQAGNLGFPTSTMFVISVIYQESFTIYMLMLILPYMTKGWRTWLLVTFTVVSWWLNTWAWYATTGLLLSDALINMDFFNLAQQGAPYPDFFLFKKLNAKNKRIPVNLFALASLAIGVILKFVWADSKPQDIDNEYVVHTSTWTTGGLNQDYNAIIPVARVDNYFFVLGVMLFIELNAFAQKLFNNPLSRYFGRLSFSMFLLQGSIVYSVGVKLLVTLEQNHGFNHAVAQLICFIVCFPLTVLCSDIFARLVDNPSKALADWLWVWIRE